jgi:DNA-binding GntR family transcriptional regulator
MLSLNILPAAYLKDDVAAGSVTEPMTDFLQRCCGKKAGYAIADFMARDADDEVARLLNVPRGTPVVELDEVFHDEGGVPLVLAQNIYQGRHLRFRIIGWGISTVW